MPLSRVLESCLYVTDLEAAERFYVQVLGLTLLTKQAGRHLFFRCGEQMVLLFDAEESQKPGEIPVHGAVGAGHLAFAVSNAEQLAWRERLAQHHVAIEREIDWPGGGHSLYFRDPSGNSLEFASPKIWGLREE
jgi:catechol 2,3-dioxygenase-like lactoylglutathione lyase family enzyme